MNKKTKIVFKAFGVGIMFFLSGISSFAQYINTDNAAKLPFKVDFTKSELSLLNSLDSFTLEKIIKIAKLIYEQKISTPKISNPITNSILYSTLSQIQPQTQTQQNPSPVQLPKQPPQQIQNQYPLQQNPYIPQQVQQNTLQSQPLYQAQEQNPYSSFLPFSGPNEEQSGLQPFLTAPGQEVPKTALGALFSGMNAGLSQADNEKLKNLFSGNGQKVQCENFGIVGGENGGGAENLTPKLKFDLCHLYKLTGKKLFISPNGSKRVGNQTGGDCDNKQSQHQCGKAIDTTLAPYSEEEKVIVALYFFAHDYGGIGSYGLCASCAPLHLDHRVFPMRWGPGPEGYNLQYCKAENYYPSVRKAFEMVGFPPCQLVPVDTMSAKAKEILRGLGKADFAI